MSNYNRYRLSNIQYTSQKFGVNIFILFIVQGCYILYYWS